MISLENDELVKEIIANNCITSEIRKKYFNKKSFKDIRDWLEINNMDRHFTINLEAANILLVIENLNGPKKILVQVRATEKNRMGLFRWSNRRW